MKNILGWVKTNLVVVISLVVILVAIPAGFVFANGWNKKIRTEREEEARAALGSLQKTTVTYAVPAVIPGDKSLEVRAVPSDTLTAWFKEQRERVKKEVSDVIAEATAFNRKDRKVLLDGLFPAAGNRRDEEQKLLEFMALLSGRPAEAKPSAYESMLLLHGAGDKADANKIATALQDLNQRTRESNGNRQLTIEEQLALTKQLEDRRIGELRRRAQEVSFFASPIVFTTDSGRRALGFHHVPFSPQRDVPTLEQAFAYQWDFWVFDDIVTAVELANTSPDGERLSVERAPVKRIVSLNIKKPPIPKMYPEEELRGGSQHAEGGDSEASAEDTALFPGGVPLDRKVSITGRKTDDKANKVYDVRLAELVVIVASDRVQLLLSALSQTNFMTVTDLDMVDVDVWAEMRDGYYYGEDHVVKATIMVESVWLRSWLTAFMPFKVANNLGAELPEAPAEDE